MIAPMEEFERREASVRARMGERGIDVLVIYSSPGSLRFGQRGHVMYISGYEPCFGDTMVILPYDEGIEPVLEIDAAEYFPPKSTWIKDVRPPRDFVKTLKDYLRENNLVNARVGLVGEYSMSPWLYNRFLTEVEADFVNASDILENERAVKSSYEIECIRRASEIAKKGFEAAAEFAKPGVTGAEIQAEVEKACRIAGSEIFPHYTMVTSGTEDVYESWWYGFGKLKRGDLWLLDLGTTHRGYCCDICRTFVVGSPSQEQRDVFEGLLEAQKAGEKAAREGVLASEVDRAVAEVLRETFSIDWWGTGHGVGLEVHEWPFVGYSHVLHSQAYRDMVLRENMVISMEPAAYHPEVGEMQIEDEFRITKTGCERLNDIPREIIQC